MYFICFTCARRTETVLCYHTGIKPFYETDPSFPLRTQGAASRKNVTLSSTLFPPSLSKAAQQIYAARGETNQAASVKREMTSFRRGEGGRERGGCQSQGLAVIRI